MKTQNTTHTPGPWESDGSGQIYTADQRLDIALVTHHPNTKMPEPEDLANARLIAAAPELLAALEAIRNDCEDFINDEDGPGAIETMQAMREAARAAIAKATGKGQP